MAKTLPRKAGRMAAVGTKPAVKRYTFEFEQEDDGRWICEVPELPGVMAYGKTKLQAHLRAQVLALRVIADRIEKERTPQDEVKFACA